MSNNERTRSMHGKSNLSAMDRYRILADERRRLLLTNCASVSAPFETSLGELASDLSVLEAGPGGAAAKRDLLVQLHHVHLPMLEECGLLNYDPESKRIRITHPEMARSLADGLPIQFD